MAISSDARANVSTVELTTKAEVHLLNPKPQLKIKKQPGNKKDHQLMRLVLLIAAAFFILPDIAKADERSEAQLTRSRTFYKVGQYRAAIDLFQEYLRKHTSDKTVWLELAWAYVKSGEPKKATRILENLVKRAPQDIALFTAWTEMEIHNGKFNEAREVLNTARARFPGSNDLEIITGKLLLAEGKTDEAVKQFQAALLRDSRNEQATLGLAQALESQGELSQSLRYYRRTLSLKGNSEEGIAGYARVTAALGNLQKATMIYRKGLRRLPHSADLRLGLSEIYEQENQISYAIAILKPLASKNNQEAYERIERMRSVQVRADAQYDLDNAFHANTFSSLTTWFRINDSNILEHVKYSRNTFQTLGFDFSYCDRLELGLEGEFRHWLFKIAGGGDFYNDGAATPQGNGEIGIRLLKTIKLSLTSQYERLGFNAETIYFRVAAFRYGSVLNWDMTSKTQLFASQIFGKLTDDNSESQSFVRLMQGIGSSFTVGASYLNWNFATNPWNGYFSPQDYQLVSAILGYNDVLWDQLQLSLLFSSGYQPKIGTHVPVNSWEAKLSSSLTNSLDGGFGIAGSDTQGYWLQSLTGYLQGTF